MEQLLAHVAQNVEKKLDSELQRLDNLDSDDIEAIRAQRLADMKKRAQQKQEWLSNGHGEYTELASEKEFFTVCNKSENVVCHLYKQGTPRCDIVDMHLKALCLRHIETRFVKLNVERAPFLTARLKIHVIPTIALIKHNLTKHFIVGFTELGNKDDFSTAMMEWTLARYELVEYSGDLTEPPKDTPRGHRPPPSNKTIRNTVDSDDDLSD